jgi:hypothetical protein
MKALIKLTLVALVLHGTWRTGAAYLRYYQFRDGVQQIAQFSGSANEEALRRQVLQVAAGLQIPVVADGITVRRQDNHTLIDASYGERIEVLPTYHYPWRFDVSVDAFTIVPRKD